MEDTLIGFETAKLAKLKGFDVNSSYTYNDDGFLINGFEYDECFNNSEGNIIAVSQSLLQKYLRDKHNIIIIVNYQHSVLKHKSYYFNTIIKDNIEFEDTQERFGKILDKSYQNISGNYVNEELLEKYLFEDKFAFDTYEECLEYALQQALNLI